MADTTDIKAPAVESKETAVETKVEPKGETKVEPEAKVGELLKAVEAQKEEKTVPESALLEYKKENKQLWKELKKTQEMISDGATKKEVSTSLKAIAEKYKVDDGFLAELSEAMKANTDAEVEEKVNSKLKPIQDKENAARIEKIFSDHYERTLAQMPEYKDIADRDVIKSLTLDPANANKTFAQIMEKAYGHLVQGKRTIDAAKPRGGKEPAEIDFEKAQKNSTYFKEVMADPDLRKAYNSDLQKRLRL
jgi:cytochrome c1